MSPNCSKWVWKSWSFKSPVPPTNILRVSCWLPPEALGTAALASIWRPLIMWCRACGGDGRVGWAGRGAGALGGLGLPGLGRGRAGWAGLGAGASCAAAAGPAPPCRTHIQERHGRLRVSEGDKAVALVLHDDRVGHLAPAARARCAHAAAAAVWAGGHAGWGHAPLRAPRPSRPGCKAPAHAPLGAVVIDVGLGDAGVHAAQEQLSLRAAPRSDARGSVCCPHPRRPMACRTARPPRPRLIGGRPCAAPRHDRYQGGRGGSAGAQGVRN